MHVETFEMKLKSDLEERQNKKITTDACFGGPGNTLAKTKARCIEKQAIV